MSNLPEVETIARLMALARQYGVEELEVEEGGLRVQLLPPRRPAAATGEPDAGISYDLWAPPAYLPAAEAEGAAGKPGRPETAQPVTAPLTGTFYRTPGPEEPPFVEVGDTVEEGQQIGIIEAMKVFSPVNADRSGTVVELVAQNGKLVNHGDVLLYIDP